MSDGFREYWIIPLRVTFIIYDYIYVYVYIHTPLLYMSRYTRCYCIKDITFMKIMCQYLPDYLNCVQLLEVWKTTQRVITLNILELGWGPQSSRCSARISGLNSCQFIELISCGSLALLWRILCFPLFLLCVNTCDYFRIIVVYNSKTHSLY